MPMSLEEFQKGQLYSVAEASLTGTGGGEGIQVLKNEPFVNNPQFHGQYASGQYTLKKYHLRSRIPTFIRWAVPPGASNLQEEAWNAFPFVRTVVTNPDYMKDNFRVCIETLHVANDRGQQDNIHQLTPAQLKQREVVTIDICDDVPKADYLPEFDPTTFKSVKTGRGPLTKGWSKTCTPVMTCYKLVTVEFKWFGFGNSMQKFLHGQELRVFVAFHRQMFCWMDKWYDLSMDEIRAYEEEVKRKLDEIRDTGAIRGMTVPDQVGKDK